MSQTFAGIYGELPYNQSTVGGCAPNYEHFWTTRSHTGGTMRFNLTKVSGTQSGGNLSLAHVYMYLRSSNGNTAVRYWAPGERGWKNFGIVPAGQFAFSVRPCFQSGGRSSSLWFHGTLQTSIKTGAN